MRTLPPNLPVFAIDRHRLTTDGQGVTTLVGAYGCPLRCKYCLNPHAWNPDTLKKCIFLTPKELIDKVKIDHLYFLSTNGGVTFGGGESLLHADFIHSFREICGNDWNLTVETSLNVPKAQLTKIIGVVNNYIVDIKDLNPEIYQTYTSASIDQTMSNLSLLVQNVSPEQIHIRVPKIPEYNTKEDINHSICQLKKLGFTKIEVFPYILSKKAAKT